jgi:threonine dehydrogenase-like Zn-dependent dehydrogenase
MTGDVASFKKTVCTVVVSGAAAAYDLAFKITATHGKIIAIGVPHNSISVNILDMVMADLSLIGNTYPVPSKVVVTNKLSSYEPRHKGGAKQCA